MSTANVGLGWWGEILACGLVCARARPPLSFHGLGKLTGQSAVVVDRLGLSGGFASAGGNRLTYSVGPALLVGPSCVVLLLKSPQ